MKYNKEEAKIYKNNLSINISKKNYIPITEELGEEIIRKYVNQKYSINNLVGEYNISKQRISRFLKVKGIKIDSNRCKLTNSIKLSENQISNVFNKYKSGKNIKNISIEENISIQIVSRILHDSGLRISKRFKNGKRYDGRKIKNN